MNQIQWLTTAPNPYARGYGTDDGQRGWRTHAVVATDKTTFAEVRGARALCGLRPVHGWGMDLFIEARCQRCESALRRAGQMSAP